MSSAFRDGVVDVVENHELCQARKVLLLFRTATSCPCALKAQTMPFGKALARVVGVAECCGASARVISMAQRRSRQGCVLPGLLILDVRSYRTLARGAGGRFHVTPDSDSDVGALRESFAPAPVFRVGENEEGEGQHREAERDEVPSTHKMQGVESQAASGQKSPSEFRNDRAVMPLNPRRAFKNVGDCPLSEQVWTRGDSFDLGLPKGGSS